MALIPIPGQPVNLVPSNESNHCNINKSYCSIVKKDSSEFIMVQMKQEPCGEDLIVDGNFPDGSAWVIVSGDITFADNKAVHVVGSSAKLKQTITGVDAGTYFRVSFTVTGMSAGTIGLYFTQTGTPSVTITENGIYNLYLYNLGDSDDINFVWSSTCDAEISQVSVYQMLAESDLNAKLLDLDGNITGYLTPVLQDEFITFRLATSGLDEGCYYVSIIDPCSIDLGAMTERIIDPNFDDNTKWTVTNIDCVAAVSGGAFAYNATVSPFSYVIAQANQAFNLPVADTIVYAEITTGTIQGDVNVGFYVDGSAFATFIGVESNKTYSIFFRYDSNYFNGTELTQTVDMRTNTPNTLGQTSEILGVRLLTISPSSISGSADVLNSNCFSILPEHDCAKLIEGYGDTGTTTHGFLWQDFKLSHRIQFLSFNPFYPIEGDNYMFSDTSRKQTYATRERYTVGKINYIDQTAHDTVSAQIICKTFNVDGVQYFVTQQGYKPEWNNEGQQKLSQAKIEMRKILGTLYSK